MPSNAELIELEPVAETLGPGSAHPPEVFTRLPFLRKIAKVNTADTSRPFALHSFCIQIVTANYLNPSGFHLVIFGQNSLCSLRFVPDETQSAQPTTGRTVVIILVTVFIWQIRPMVIQPQTRSGMVSLSISVSFQISATLLGHGKKHIAQNSGEVCQDYGTSPLTATIQCQTVQSKECSDIQKLWSLKQHACDWLFDDQQHVANPM